jgi:hypothetical protein
VSARGTCRRLGCVLLPALLGSGTGCVNTDPTVFVDATIADGTVTVAKGALVSTVAGSFNLSFHLGPRAADTAEVTLGALSLVNADRSTTFVPSLAVVTAPAFPVAVPVDSDVVVGVSFSAQDNQLPTATYDAICQAGSVLISGAFEDSLRGTTSTMASSPITPAGCP